MKIELAVNFDTVFVILHNSSINLQSRIRVSVASFDSVDANKDGVVDATEFEKWAEKRLHLKPDQRKSKIKYILHLFENTQKKSVFNRLLLKTRLV